jgi:hypothetical protein
MAMTNGFPPLRFSRIVDMNVCKECELAVYCYSEPSTWVFRTRQEMEEKQAAICNCPLYKQVHLKSGVSEEQSSAAQ